MDQNTTPEIQTPAQDPTIPAQVPVETKYSWKYVLLGLVLVLLIGVGAFLLGRKSSDTNDIAITQSPTPTTTASPSITPSQPVQDQNGSLTYTSKVIPEIHENKLWNWRPFVLHYPSLWSIVEDKYSEESVGGPLLMLKMSKKDGSYFELLQGFADGGRCVYTNDPDLDSYHGAGSVYTTYDEIVKGDETWRLSLYEEKDPLELWTHQLCGLSKNGWFLSSYNSLGIHKIKLVGDESYREFLEILKQVEIK